MVTSIHPRRHLFIRLVARDDSIAATPFLHSAGSVTASPSLHSFCGSRRLHCRDTISSFGRQRHRAAISLFVWPAHRSPRHNLFSGPATPQSFQRAGQSHRCAAIITVGRRIPLPCRNHFSGPVNHIVAPQSFQRAGESHRRAAFFSTGRQIPSPRHHLFSGPARHHFSAGRRISLPRRNLFSGLANPIISAGQRIPSPSRQISSRPAHHRQLCQH